MRHTAVVGLVSLLTVACQDATAPHDAPRISPDLGTLAGSFNASAVFGSDSVVEGTPVQYTVDFGVAFSSISEVDYFFTFGSDPLDAQECLFFRVGFCNPGPAPQFSRLLSIPCANDPGECDLFRDGVDTRQLTAGWWLPGAGPASVKITSLAITIQGTVATPAEQVQGIVDRVEQLGAGGTLGQGLANSLIQKLRRAIALLNAGKPVPAVGVLNAFIHEVTGLMAGPSSVLTPAQGQPLIAAASAVIAAL
jgi:hypothetical protein